MTSRGEQRMISDRLGVRAEAAGWCTIDKIPDPPAEVLQAAGNPRLRPAVMPPLGMLGTAVGALLMPFVMLLSLLDSAREALDRLFESKKDEKRRAREDEARRKAIVAEQGLDRVFDGNWSGAAGQFLLRWYGHSSHHQRFVVATEDEVVLAAPPKRVSVGRDKRMEVVARLATGQAVLFDPFLGEFRTQLLLLKFHDGSWLRLTTEEFRGELHMHVLRQPSSGN
ncbi:hypothetical protein CP970_18165 [Streptomyces kanamyceticus]|uniref:Uncharacterized protein n=2 Tax=Streptomyces kanamyceticus TaxID=1967 RepID=A0A5J6GDM2_STRKN|nr:hypothetical protein CP970_18165 [Streptomyces kanamyceticus]